MSVLSAVSSIGPAKAADTSTTGGTNALDKDAFLRLLVTQLKNQDPSKPMDDTQFISQLAQFSSLEQMSNVNDGLNVLTQMQLTTQAMSLVGKNVELNNPAGKDPITGKVDGVKFESGIPKLQVGGKEYNLSDVLSIKS